MTHNISMPRTNTRFKVFFDRVDTPHHEEAMNQLLERVDNWASEGNRAIMAWKWRHMAEGESPGRTYAEVEIIYRETTQLTQETNESLARTSN